MMKTQAKKIKTILTVGDVRDEKRAADAVSEYNDALRARIERDRQEYIAARLLEYPEIGKLNSGKFYAFIGDRSNYVESFFLTRVIDAVEDARSKI